MAILSVGTVRPGVSRQLGFDDWASRALDEAEKARLAGDRYTEIERMYIFGEIVSCGNVTFHRNA